VRRREFIALLGGTAAWPLAARAQQPTMPTVGLVNAGSPESAAYRTSAFRQGLSEAGYIKGRNVTIEYRWAEGHHERVPELVADLVRRRVAVIATPGDTSAALAAKAATSTIPIVFGVGQDPVKPSLVASLARPGGNATCVNFFIAELAAKRLGLLREMVPHTARVAALLNPANAANAEATLQDLQTGSRATGLQIRVLNASSRGEIDAAFAMLAREKLDALFVSGDGFFNSRRVQLALLAVRYAVPGNLFAARLSRGWRADELWNAVSRRAPPGRRLHRPDPQGRQARRLAGIAADKVRACHQHPSGQSDQPRGAADAARPRRRGDRMSYAPAFAADPGG
jgi:putative tryptophan/tyrosine transport system substrate-binding protein